MYEQMFTAARAEQHRDELMDAARQARDYRKMRSTRSRGPRLRPSRVLRPAKRPATGTVQVVNAS
jgi:hypothetical protein